MKPTALRGVILMRQALGRAAAAAAGAAIALSNGCISTGSSAIRDGFVEVKGGLFEMGDSIGGGNPEETPTHQVAMSSFYLSRYEVTFDQYDTFCCETGRGTLGDAGWGRGTRPAINVGWSDAAEYCNWLSEKEGFSPFYSFSGTSVKMDWSADGYRLPTEAEWEYAARGGARSRESTYAGSGSADSVAWYSMNSERRTHPVGEKNPNELGLYDMSGNVWEWCNDWYAEDYYASSPPTDPSGPDSGSMRVFRGGSWACYLKLVRVSDRNRELTGPHGIVPSGGFRPARPVTAGSGRTK